MNRYLLSSLFCLCATGALAQPMRTGGEERPNQREQRREGLRNDLRQGRIVTTAEQVREAPPPRQLSAGEHAQLRQQLRQQQIETIRVQP